MKQKPVVSIVITSYDNIEYIEQAIVSSFAQEIDKEIIVVDDCSSDGSWQLLQSIELKYGLILKRPEKNLGMAGARNFGLKFVSGDFVNFLDGDDYLLPGKLTEQVEFMLSHPNIDASYCDTKLLIVNKMASFTLKDVWAPQSGEIFTHLLLGNFIAIHAALLRKIALEKLQFDTNKRNAADYDFWLKFARKNEVHFIDKPLVVYRRTGNTNTKDNRLPLINETLSILREWDKTDLSEEQRQNISIHLSKTYLARADHLFMNWNVLQGYEDVVTANRLLPLTGSLGIIYRLMSFSKYLGVLLYLMRKRLARLLASARALFGKERKFI